MECELNQSVRLTKIYFSIFISTADVRLYICIVIFFILFVPLWVQIARGNIYTRDVLGPGWVPIISAMFISR